MTTLLKQSSRSKELTYLLPLSRIFMSLSNSLPLASFLIVLPVEPLMCLSLQIHFDLEFYVNEIIEYVLLCLNLLMQHNYLILCMLLYVPILSSLTFYC